ncbi:MAG: PAS domain S-box protein [Rhodospirillales bacterium]|nr:PAS domain S-box protein [Rhodospirillales bacterium]MCB9964613.1 PAS domain S-box protein [Rhodospirillales bacterium]MCB9979902.1 PAS domain S-box protein [Rhodospirillales bacterium]
MLDQNNSYIKFITDNTADALVTIDKSGIIKSVNPACEDMFGYHRDELVGRNVSCLVAGEHAAKHDSYISDYMRTGHAKIIGIGRYLNARHKRGKIFPIHLSISEITLDGELYFSGVIKDKSKIIDKQDFEAWQAQRQYLEKAEHAAGIGHWRVDLLKGEVFWSNEMYHICGVNPEAFVPTVDFTNKFFHPEDGKNLQNQVDQAVLQEKDFNFETRLLQPDGEIRYIQVFGEPEVDENGDVVAIFGVFRDVTIMKMIELELERSNKDLESFAFTVSHDLKAPLRHISMATGFLSESLENALDAEQAGFMRIMTESAGKAQFMIDSLLNYSRIGRGGIAFSQVGLDDVVQAALELLTLEIQESDAEIVCDELPVIPGNEGLLIRLFQNMIENALKYKSDGVSPKITVSVDPHRSNHIIRIADNGIGIAPEFSEKIFQMFQRLHGESAPYKGMGIGLAICRKIMHAHKGDIELDPDYQDGAAFLLIFPKTTEKHQTT